MPDSEDINLFDDEEVSESELPKKLRAKIKELSGKLSELEQENTALKSEKRSQYLMETLSARGLNAGIAKFVPSDLDDEGVDAWLSENAELFAGGQTQQSPQETIIARDAEQAAAIRQMANAERGQATAPAMDSVLSGIENAQSMDELMQVLREA